MKNLFEKWAQSPTENIEILPVSGSDRRYTRFRAQNGLVALAVYNQNTQENEAFIRLSSYFLAQGVAVPQVYATQLEKNIYLVEELGTESLLDVLQKQQNPDGSLNPKMLHYYQQSLQQLAFMQTQAAKELPDEYLLPPTRFDAQIMNWDFNYFKYCFLMPSKVAYDEYRLALDFNRLVAFLEQAPSDFFLFRDFQARNIMVHNEKVYFIDYQGAKRGALAYDVASLLLQAKAKLSPATRGILLDYYINCLKNWVEIDEPLFRQQYEGFELMRSLQVLGAYGSKGYIDRKPHFLESVPFALDNLEYWLNKQSLPIEMPHLIDVLRRLIAKKRSEQNSPKLDDSRLHLQIQSFSYPINGVPEMKMGGFVFDCRALPDPADLAEYEPLTGLDAPVQAFLLAKKEVLDFLNNIFNILTPYIRNRQKPISISFGCVGGKHRSVFVAKQTLRFLQKAGFDVSLKISLKHLAQPHLGVEEV